MKRKAFTLIELLIVMSIIVIVLGLAVAAFNTITGSKSKSAMFNNLGGMVARARNEAIRWQRPCGLMFYRDAEGADAGTIRATLVRALVSVTPSPPVGAAFPNVMLELLPDTDSFALPAGVGLEFVDEADSGSASDDKYIGFNVTADGPPTAPVQIGGVILFNGHGELISTNYAFQTHLRTDSSDPATDRYTTTGVFLYGVQPTDAVTLPDAYFKTVNPAIVERSQIAMVIFDEGLFLEKFGTDAYRDMQFVPGSDPVAEATEENWLAGLDASGNESPERDLMHIMINRYTGVLMKAE